MKKILVLFFVSLIAALTLSCNLISIQDQDTFDAPIPNQQSTSISVSIRKFSSETKYITLYRRDITNNTEADAVIEKIALLYPSEYPDGASYSFEDIYTLANHKYQYKVRYCEPDGYYPSSWSITVTPPTGYGYVDASALRYNTSGVRFIYSDSDFTMRINGTIVSPQIPNYLTEWHPVMAFQTDKVSQVYTLSNIADGTVISMAGLLTSDFYNTDVKVLGILGEKIVYNRKTPNDTNPPIKCVIWTLPTTIEIQGHSSNIIKIKAQTGTTGYDYS